MNNILKALEKKLGSYTQLKGIKYQFVVPTLVITFGVTLTLGLVLSAISLSGINDSMNSKGQAILAFLTKVSPTYISNYDLTALESFVGELAKNSDVAYAAFYDKSGKVLAENIKGGTDLTGYSIFENEITAGDGAVLGRFKIAYRRNVLIQRFALSIVWALICVFLALYVIGTRVYKIASEISEKLNHVSDLLLKSVEELTKSGSEINTISQKLTASCHETDASLQSTATNIAQFTKVAAATAKNSDQSLNKARESQKEAAEGLLVVQKFERAMSDINESNKKLGTIRDAVRQIGVKTQVIDQIVFQTKLLSFNANIEAARAGEHGRGFSVVADEVGSLAKVSGGAAKEISKLLLESSARVDESIRETGSKAEAGQSISLTCAEVFKKIAANITVLDTMSSAISKAAMEQEAGVRDASSSISSISEASNKNTHLAQQAAEMAGFLQNQAEALRKNVSQLDYIVGAAVENTALGHDQNYDLNERAS